MSNKPPTDKRSATRTSILPPSCCESVDYLTDHAIDEPSPSCALWCRNLVRGIAGSCDGSTRQISQPQFKRWTRVQVRCMTCTARTQTRTTLHIPGVPQTDGHRRPLCVIEDTVPDLKLIQVRLVHDRLGIMEAIESTGDLQRGHSKGQQEHGHCLHDHGTALRLCFLQLLPTADRTG